MGEIRGCPGGVDDPTTRGQKWPWHFTTGEAGDFASRSRAEVWIGALARFAVGTIGEGKMKPSYATPGQRRCEIGAMTKYSMKRTGTL